MIRRPPRSTLFPYTDALPIFGDTPIVEKMPPVQRDEEIYAGLHRDEHNRHIRLVGDEPELSLHVLWFRVAHDAQDRKSTRLNSSHSQISYAVFCLKKKSANCPGATPNSPLRARRAFRSLPCGPGPPLPPTASAAPRTPCANPHSGSNYSIITERHT